MRDSLTYQELSELEFSKLHILRRVALESVWGLLEPCEIISLEPGDLFIEKGQSNQTMYLVLTGRLSVHLDKADGEPVAFLEVGQTVGEISVIDDSPATAYVRAVSQSRLLAIDEETFWRLVEVSHPFATNMLLLLAGRLRANNSTIMASFQQRLILEHEATVDALTALRNRRWLDQTLPRLTNRHNFSGRPLCLLMMDVDHFKRFNDDFGHAAGDQVLRSVGKVVAGNLRPTDLGARYGGEEFCVMLPETPMEGAIVAADRIRLAVAAQNVCCDDGRILPPVTISCGVACQQRGEQANALIGRADAALYKAKENGRNRIEVG